MLTHFAACTLWTACPRAPVADSRQPFVLVAIRALVADPPDFLMSVRRNHDAPKVSIGCIIPLLLQVWSQKTDVRAFLLKMLLAG